MVLPAFNNVEAPPSWDFILNPNSGVVPVLWSWITILISLFTDDLALSETQLNELMKVSISGIEKVADVVSLSFESSKTAFSWNSVIGILNSSSEPFMITKSLS